MIRDYFVLLLAYILIPMKPFIMRKLKDDLVIHITAVKLGGLSKFVDTLMKPDDVYIKYVRGFYIMVYRNIPILIGSKNYLDIPRGIIHIHQLDYYPWKFRTFLKDRQYIMTIHDYYYICPRYFMINEEGYRCSSFDCMKCCNVDPIKWKNAMYSILKDAKYVVVPNVTVMKNLVTHFNLNNILVIEHGT